MSVLIRPVEPDEIPSLAAIEKSAGELFRSKGLDDIADDDPADPTFILSCLRFGAVLVAEVDKQLAGFAMVAEFDGHAHLYEVSVSCAFQGKGIGRALVDAAAQWAVDQGHWAITLSTFSDIPWNAPFYEKAGYRLVPSSEWTPGLLVLRRLEEGAGLDIDRRCVMRKELNP